MGDVVVGPLSAGRWRKGAVVGARAVVGLWEGHGNRENGRKTALGAGNVAWQGASGGEAGKGPWKAPGKRKRGLCEDRLGPSGTRGLRSLPPPDLIFERL